MRFSFFSSVHHSESSMAPVASCMMVMMVIQGVSARTTIPEKGSLVPGMNEIRKLARREQNREEQKLYLKELNTQKMMSERKLTSDYRFNSDGSFDMEHTVGTSTFLDVAVESLGACVEAYNNGAGSDYATGSDYTWFGEEAFDEDASLFFDPHGGTASSAIDDYAFVYYHKSSDACILAIRGTDFSNWDDAMQNVDLAFQNVCQSNDASKCCSMRRGNARVTPIADAHVQACMAHTTSGGTTPSTLIVTGHSQGGAIATASGLYHDQYNPYIITFGQPGVVHENDQSSCPGKYSSYSNGLPNIYRFINTDEESLFDGIDYDIVAGLHWSTEHIGQAIILANNDRKNVAYFEEFDFSGFDSDLSAHSSVDYKDKLEGVQTQANNGVTIGSTGWVYDEFCNVDDECKGSFICRNEHCQAGLLDDYCDYDSDCHAVSGGGYCWGIYGITDYTCYQKEPNGSYCSVDRECLSNHCGFKRWYSLAWTCH